MQLFACLALYRYVCMRVCMYVCMYACMYVCTGICVLAALSGGIMPVSAVLTSDEVMLTIKPGQHGMHVLIDAHTMCV